MAEANKTYGFTIAVKELRETVPNIFRYASAYKRLNNLTSKGLWEMFVEPPPEKPTSLPTDDPKYKAPLPEEILKMDPGRGMLPEVDPEAMESENYNMCHFWSNFEIARLDWFRSKAYEDFFEMMDRSGGFWMERVSVPSTLLPPLIANHGDPSSGVMPQSIPWLPGLYFLQRISITSVILAIDTLPSSIVPRTPQLGNSQGSHF
jgi:hypothetical protein